MNTFQSVKTLVVVVTLFLVPALKGSDLSVEIPPEVKSSADVSRALCEREMTQFLTSTEKIQVQDYEIRLHTVDQLVLGQKLVPALGLIRSLGEEVNRRNLSEQARQNIRNRLDWSRVEVLMSYFGVRHRPESVDLRLAVHAIFENENSFTEKDFVRKLNQFKKYILTQIAMKSPQATEREQSQFREFVSKANLDKDRDLKPLQYSLERDKEIMNSQAVLLLMQLDKFGLNLARERSVVENWSQFKLKQMMALVKPVIYVTAGSAAFLFAFSQGQALVVPVELITKALLGSGTVMQLAETVFGAALVAGVGVTGLTTLIQLGILKYGQALTESMSEGTHFICSLSKQAILGAYEEYRLQGKAFAHGAFIGMIVNGSTFLMPRILNHLGGSALSLSQQWSSVLFRSMAGGVGRSLQVASTFYDDAVMLVILLSVAAGMTYEGKEIWSNGKKMLTYSKMREEVDQLLLRLSASCGVSLESQDNSGVRGVAADVQNLKNGGECKNLAKLQSLRKEIIRELYEHGTEVSEHTVNLGVVTLLGVELVVHGEAFEALRGGLKHVLEVTRLASDEIPTSVNSGINLAQSMKSVLAAKVSAKQVAIQAKILAIKGGTLTPALEETFDAYIHRGDRKMEVDLERIKHEFGELAPTGHDQDYQ